MEGLMTTYFARLIQHLIPLSHCPPDTTVQEFLALDIISQWQIMHSEYDEEESHCPCGTSIKERCYIQNTHSNAQLYVGSRCIERFGGDNAEMVRIILSLSNGLTLRVHAYNPEDKSYDFTFVSTTSTVFQKRDQVMHYFGSVPIVYHELRKSKVYTIRLHPGKFSGSLRLHERYHVQISVKRTSFGCTFHLDKAL